MQAEWLLKHSFVKEALTLYSKNPLTAKKGGPRAAQFYLSSSKYYLENRHGWQDCLGKAMHHASKNVAQSSEIMQRVASLYINDSHNNSMAGDILENHWLNFFHENTSVENYFKILDDRKTFLNQQQDLALLKMQRNQDTLDQKDRLSIAKKALGPSKNSQ